MTVISPTLLKGVLAMLLSPAMVIASGLPTPTNAQLVPPLQVSVNFPQANTNRGAPPRSRGAASRGACGNSENARRELEIAALTPKDNILKTDASNPNIYLSVPALRNAPAEVLIVDKEDDTVVYAAQLELNRTEGIFKLALPENLALRPDRIYTWSFALICDLNDRGIDLVVEGWIERSPLTSTQKAQIEQAKATQQTLKVAEIYAQAGLWNETFNALLPLRESNPTAWSELLNSVELGEFAQVPMSEPVR
ncbi:DUF928 domain-containing protein [Lusitaniella coriacea LEGE 07157]|uniref:DUF928 domain-containing protein n=1 Tax=Lusitaniella coriacea LEGE 07157 TaxID=945747 RepID=A0A8J7DXL3_9CYAN|nr:DUF928 domain-containing protein [Lusitaniella coriacea]MBE9117186.1 DUF928 domain-containing protein [Lusitaniella coriacea LEGE 07157]